MFTRARLRLTVWYAAALAVIFIVTGGSAYIALKDQLDDEINGSLRDATTSLRLLPPQMVAGLQDNTRPRRDNDDDGGRRVLAGLSSDIFYLVTDANGAVLFNSRNIDTEDFPLAQLAQDAATGPLEADIKDEDGHYRLLAQVQTVPNAPEGRLFVGRSLEARDYQLRALAIVLAAGGAAGVALAALGGFWIAGRTLVPIRLTLETQRRFVSDASHELRTPVAVMKANAELMLRHPEQTVEANIDQVAAINEEADHMAKLVGELLTLARADEHQIQMDRQPLNLDELLDGLVRDMTALAEAKGVALSANLKVGEVDADQQRMRQVGAILLDNALKFTPSGGKVAVKAFRDGRHAVVQVSDTGPGIAPEDQPHIFERFYRSDKARGAGGTGLGLSIAEWIAHAHGGRIWVESVPGNGSVFSVRFPARK